MSNECVKVYTVPVQNTGLESVCTAEHITAEHPSLCDDTLEHTDSVYIDGTDVKSAVLNKLDTIGANKTAWLTLATVSATDLLLATELADTTADEARGGVTVPDAVDITAAVDELEKTTCGTKVAVVEDTLASTNVGELDVCSILSIVDASVCNRILGRICKDKVPGSPVVANLAAASCLGIAMKRSAGRTAGLGVPAASVETNETVCGRTVMLDNVVCTSGRIGL